MSLSKRDLREHQYATPDNLSARIALHQRFSTTDESIWEWVWSRYSFSHRARILEVGCGRGDFWSAEQGRVPDGSSKVLLDLSRGMVETSRRKVDAAGFLVGDVERLPFPDCSFDVVLSHFMLYHADDKPLALAEMTRVLRPSGWAGIVTLGGEHMMRITELGVEIDPEMPPMLRSHSTFSESDADRLLPEVFDQVQKHAFPGQLHITDAQAVIDYLQSIPSFQQVTPAEGFFDRYRSAVQDEIDSEGHFEVSKRTVLYICTGDKDLRKE